MNKNEEYYLEERERFIAYMNKNLYKLIDSHIWNLKRLGSNFWTQEDRDFLYHVSLFGFDGGASDFDLEVKISD